MYIVIGANGYLGSYFIKNILTMTDERILATARHRGKDYGPRVEWAECDITKEDDAVALNEAYLKVSKDNKVLFLAAYHHPDLVEENPRIAWNTNVTSLSRFMNLADNVSRFFYPSTDSVYGEGGKEYRFRESDALNPVNRYGVQKTVAEKLITAYGYNVVRFPFLIAPSLLPSKKHFYDVIAETLAEGKPFEMFADSYRSTLSFNTVSQLVIQLIEKKDFVPQIINVCGDRAYSKYEVGLMIADKIGASRDLVIPISINDSTGIFEAKRAGSTVMDNSLLKKTLGLQKVELEL